MGDIKNLMTDLIFVAEPRGESVCYLLYTARRELITFYGTDHETWAEDLRFYSMLRDDTTSPVLRLVNVMEELIRRLHLYHDDKQSLPLLRLLRMFAVRGSKIGTYKSVILDTGHLRNDPEFAEVLQRIAVHYRELKKAE